MRLYLTKSMNLYIFYLKSSHANFIYKELLKQQGLTKVLYNEGFKQNNNLK